MKIKPNPYLKNLNCLYVEDDLNIQTSFIEILKRIFKTVYTANNGEKGLHLYKEKNPDIIITDIKMPVMDGLTLAKKIKEIDSGALILFLTAFTDIDFLKKAIDLGVEGYLTKPIDKKKLYQKLNFLAGIIKNKKEAEENLRILNKIFEENENALILVKADEIKLKNSAFLNEFGDFNSLDELEKAIDEDLIFSKKNQIIKLKKDNIKKAYKVTYKQSDSSHTIITFENITEFQNELYIDELTKAYNKKYFKSIFPSMINKEICFIIIDIDDFKKINDTHGHLIGDIILKILSETIKENLRKDDIFIRWGGEEFLVIPKKVNDCNAAYKIAENLRIKIYNTNYMEVDKVSCSFGVACKYINNKEDIFNLFTKADKALYKAKNNGKNQVGVIK